MCGCQLFWKTGEIVYDSWKKNRIFSQNAGTDAKATWIVNGIFRKHRRYADCAVWMWLRTPKEDLILTFAKVLEISPLALTVPNISNFDELMHLLFMLEDEFGLKISCTRKGEVFLSFKPSDEKQSNLLYIMLMEWAYETQLLSSDKRTKQDYDEWRYSYSHQTTPKPRKKYRIRGLKKVKDDLTHPAQ